MAELNTFVHVTSPDGVSHAFGPGMTLPDWAVQKISNPDVWVAREGAPADESSSARSPHEQEQKPKSNWSVRQLKAYASERGVDLGDAKSKADIYKILR